MKYIIVTLGCKVNQVETQAMESLLRSHGHEPAAEGECAEAVIVNSCAVTAESGRKTRQTVRRLRDGNPGAVVAVCGCYSQLEPEVSAALGADVIYGSSDRVSFVTAVEEAVSERKKAVFVDRPFERHEMEPIPAGALDGRTRAMLKVQDGCANFCSYCVIPYTRGRPRSLPMEKAAEESARMEAAGCRELILTGIEIASYGIDLPGKPDLADLVSTIAQNAGSGMRIRLGSLEPTVVTESFCERLAAAGKLCRHFHLSLQSGCDRTLKAMNRKYDTAFFLSAVGRLRKAFPGCAISTDLITGFPGESEGDHAETLRFLETCAFSHMHIFPYSRRPGTQADKMPEQCTAAVKARRAAEAKEVAARMHAAYLGAQCGLTLEVLFENGSGDGSVGHSDNYLLVRVPENALAGQVKNVKITSVSGSELVGFAV